MLPAMIGADRALGDYREYSDEQLVTRVLTGQTALFEVLMRRYNQRLFRLARGILRDDGDALETVHEAYIQAYDRLDGLRQGGAFAAWVCKIALRNALARAQALRRSPQADPECETADRRGQDPEQLAAVGELRAVLEQAIDRLPQTSRQVFILREVEGLTTAAVAQLLDCSEEAVKVRLHRARKALRLDIDEQLGAAAGEVFAFAGERCDRMVLGVLGALQEGIVA